MVSTHEVDFPTFNKFSELCNKLNLDPTAAFENYTTISQNYTLEGDPTHWFACAIFVASSKSSVPTGGSGVTQGNCVNFTSLLRHSKLSLAQFFCNIKKWIEMSQLPEEFTHRVDKLEESFAVAYNVFREYAPMFLEIFKAPELVELESTKQHRNRKQRYTTLPIACTSFKVFEFCWLVFITIKSLNSKYSNDLVSSCNLLVAICDWAFKNAFLADRRDLLNPDFKGLPENWASLDYVKPESAPCIISLLCSTPEIVTEVKYIKEYRFKESIKQLFASSVLIGKDDDELDVLDPFVFDRNYKNITTTYETNVLNKGEFDEKIFLAEHKRKLLEIELNQNKEANQVGNTSNPATPRPMGSTQECLTPLTGRRYLMPREPTDSTGCISAAEKIVHLNTLLRGCQPSPSPNLSQLLSTCTRNPIDRIATIVEALSAKFIAAYSLDRETANMRLDLSKKLFYKRIENILENERVIQADISAIVEKDVFYECIFACSLEIVLHTYSNPMRFPWVLNTLEVQAYNFIKVIELIIRSKEKFARDTIKHLNMIEELILSSLIWKSDSVIWEAIENSEQGIPKFEETALPGQIQGEAGSEQSGKGMQNDAKILQSPGPSATDRFQSPVQHGGFISRELFPTGQAGLPTHPPQLVIKDANGKTRMIQVKIQSTTPKREIPAPVRPRRTGGLSIIFRKFYNLAWERMEHLCNNLKITNTETQRKIWTAFEELIGKNNCVLIKDRDLDQLLMCAVYIMITKLTKPSDQKPLLFADIIKSYRSQPQATSAIYRKVLISKKTTKINTDGATEEVPELRGDLIKFYNLVVIEAMKKFAQNFVDRGTNNTDILLSPLPASRGGLMMQVYGNICIKPLESPAMGLSNGKVFNYYFNRSPSKDLNDINKAVKGNGGVIGKRLLIGGSGDAELPNPKRIATRKVQSMLEERNQNTE